MTLTRRWIARLALVALACSTFAFAPAAYAGERCPATCVAGNYRIKVQWQGDHPFVTVLTLSADHAGVIAGGVALTWTKGGGRFSFDLTSGGVSATYTGFRNDDGGFNRRGRLGTTLNSEGRTGVWWAQPLP